MTVYVDDMKAPYGRMTMCHMLADSTHELLAMADRIGVARKWLQHPGTPREHFDICLSKRAMAVKAGARTITLRETGMLVRRKREVCRGGQAEADGARPAQEASMRVAHEQGVRTTGCADGRAHDNPVVM